MAADVSNQVGIEISVSGISSLLPSRMAHYRVAASQNIADSTYSAGAVNVVKMMHNLWLDQVMCDVVTDAADGAADSFGIL